MKNSVKLLVLITIISLISFSASSQFKLPKSNGVSGDIKKVIEDYPNRFINIMGEIITQYPQSTDYQCNFKVNGAEESFVTRYSAKKEVCSWEALMLTTESFDKAKQKFRTLYSQLQNMPVKLGVETYKLKGEYESPAEDKKFTGVLFSLDHENEKAARLKIEILMQYVEPMEWKVKVLVYDRERDDDERGAIKE